MEKSFIEQVVWNRTSCIQISVSRNSKKFHRTKSYSCIMYSIIMTLNILRMERKNYVNDKK